MNDIARILRRDCPRDNHILECCRNLPNTQDDLWPLDGTEDPEALHARRNRRNENSDATSELPMFKRRKIEHNEADGELPISHTRSMGIAITNIACSIGTTTTMQNSSCFTHHTDSGFISAAAQLQQDKQERQQDEVTKATSKRKKGSLVSTELGRTPLTTAGACSKVSYHPASQGSLMNFFGKKTIGRTPQGTTKKSATVAVLEIMGNGGDSMEHHSDLELPAKDTTSKARVAVPIETIRTAASRRPLAAIPSALGNHKIRPTNNIGRPCLPTTDNDQPPKPYVFLSSSPPPPESVVEKVEAKNDDLLHSMAVTGKAQLNAQMRYKNNHVRPAATFHTTSVTQVQAAPNIHKKTLGVRRSMTGWANRANKGFSVPSKADDKT